MTSQSRLGTRESDEAQSASTALALAGTSSTIFRSPSTFVASGSTEARFTARRLSLAFPTVRRLCLGAVDPLCAHSL